MTEYEAASLTLQLAAVWVAAIVGAAQCSLIGYGLYIMRRAAIQRDALHQENMAQHRETMKALDSRHQENLGALERRHRENMSALNAQRETQNEQHRENMAALMELIRRTSAPSAQEDG